MTLLPIREDARGARGSLAAGTLLGSVFAFATTLCLLAARIERSPLAREPRLLDYAHVTLASLFVALSFGAVVLGLELLASRLTNALAGTLERWLGRKRAELVLRSWLGVGAPTFFLVWLLTKGTRAWTPNVTVWVLLGASLVGSLGVVWTLDFVARALRPRARERRLVAGLAALALAVALALGWAKLTEPFGLRYGKSHLVTFGVLVAGLSLVFTEMVRAFEQHGNGRAWGVAWGFGLLASAAGFALSPSAAARELFYAERPTRWFALMLAPLGPDADGDGFERPVGFSAGEDCDDRDALRNPRQPEILGNGVDDNCFAGDQNRSFRELFADTSVVFARERPTRNVLVLLLDSWRFDVRSPTGVSIEQSPVIADFARTSLVFANYRTCAPRTLESFGDLFFGRLIPTFRGAPPTSAVAVLTRAGVHTVDISSRFRHEHDRVSGWSKELSIPGRYGAFDDASTVAETKRVLQDGIPQPFFVATHLMGAHEPYEPHAECAAGSEGYDRYVCAIRLLDERVGDILGALSNAGLADDTVVVISADHGEEFGEHGARYHANTVYDEVLRVPLLVHIPGATAETIREPLGCFDFMPTLLGAANLPGDPELIGHDFSRGPRPGDRAQFARTRPLDSRGVFEPKTLSVVVGDMKLLVDRKSGLTQYFDLRSDPEERRPLAHVAPSAERALSENMDAWLSELARQSVPGERTASARH